MKTSSVVYSLLVVLVLTAILTACSSSTEPTSAPVPALPTRTAAPSPTDTPLPPTATPVTSSTWEGIPIMPGATTGDGDEESYVFTMTATPQQVRDYYELELGKLGWQLSTSEGENTSLVLTFANAASATLTISVVAKGDQVLVLLVK